MPDESTPEPAPPEPDASSPRAPTRTRTPLWERIALVVGPILVVAIVASIVIRLPYVIISPGQATPVQDAVSVSGAPTQNDDGEILFLTVRVSTQRPNVWRLGYAKLNGDSKIITEKEYLGPLDRKQSNQLDQALMDTSQDTAKYVALTRLGYTVPVVGAQVLAVQPDGPANGKLEPGDLVKAIDGKPVDSPQAVGDAIRARQPGERVVVTIERGGATRDVTITTKNDDGKARIGIISAPKYEFPVDVKIDTGSVSGPSAGLAFTLTILDELTPGSLTGGKKVAVTGTIEADGSVGEVGGVEQKAVAAKDAGATLMLVPAAEVAEAKKNAGDMRVVGVKNLDDALAALARNGGTPLPAPEVRPAA